VEDKCLMGTKNEREAHSERTRGEYRARASERARVVARQEWYSAATRVGAASERTCVSTAS